jgi:hypothetical protein
MGVDVYVAQTVLVGLTEEYGKVSQRQMGKHMDKLQCSVRNVSMLLGSWPGECCPRTFVARHS